MRLMATTLSREVIKGYFAMSLRVTAHFKVEFYVTFFGILFEPYSRRVWVFQRVGLNTKSRGGQPRQSGRAPGLHQMLLESLPYPKTEVHPGITSVTSHMVKVAATLLSEILY